MQDFLGRYYELDQLRKLIESELEKMKRVLLESFPEPVDQQIGPYHLKIYLQDRGAFDLHQIFPHLPSEELKVFIANPNNANIKELIKMGLLNEEVAQTAYSSRKVPVVSVKEGKI